MAVGITNIPSVAAQSADCGVSASELAIDSEEQAALDAINGVRASAGLPGLSLSQTLGQAAAHKATTLAVSGFLSHDDPGRSWTQRIRACGHAGQIVTENLAMGVDGGRAAVQMWQGSAPHHRNLLDPAMRAVGIARVRGGGAMWWAAVFSATADAGVAPATAAPASATASASAASAPPPRIGAAATVNAGRGDCLNVRAAPAKAATITSCVPDGTTVQITAGFIFADGISWWQINGSGWVAGDYLK